VQKSIRDSTRSFLHFIVSPATCRKHAHVHTQTRRYTRAPQLSVLKSSVPREFSTELSYGKINSRRVDGGPGRRNGGARRRKAERKKERRTHERAAYGRNWISRCTFLRRPTDDLVLLPLSFLPSFLPFARKVEKRCQGGRRGRKGVRAHVRAWRCRRIQLVVFPLERDSGGLCK